MYRCFNTLRCACSLDFKEEIVYWGWRWINDHALSNPKKEKKKGGKI